MIESVNLYKLRNSEFQQYIKDVLAFVKTGDPVALNVVSEYSSLLANWKGLEDLYKTPTGSAKTEDLEALDGVRDNALLGISSFFSAYSYSTDPVVKKHSQVLTKHLAMFGTATSISKDYYQSETANIRNIINDWDTKPELQEAITSLNLQQWRNELDIANNNFELLYRGRAVELGTATADSIKELRLVTNENYYKLRDKLNAYFVIESGADPYLTVTSSINGILGFYNDALARRVGGDDVTPPEVAPVQEG